MKNIKRNILLALFVGVNMAIAAAPAHANWEVSSKTFDGSGKLTSITCEGCWFWNCDCPQANET
ncbi:MAG TPA: hypothetical protein VF092_08715 [Longimicrobium sp.]